MRRSARWRASSSASAASGTSASRGFLHFHEDPAGFFADLKTGDDFERFRVATAGERRAFVARLRRVVREAARS